MKGEGWQGHYDKVEKKKFGVPPSGGRVVYQNIPPEGGTPNSIAVANERPAWFMECVWIVLSRI
jgi:hypothetical protein